MITNNENFGYLGNNFQLKLINQIITDKKFAALILDVIDSRYFDNQYYRLIMQMVKEYYEKYQTTPSFEALDQITRIEVTSEMAQRNIFDMIKEIKKISYEDHLWVQEKSLNSVNNKN